MPAVSEAAVLNALKSVTDPDLGRDIVSLGFVKNLTIDGGRVAFVVELTTPACPVKDQMREQARAAVSALGGVDAVDIEMTASVRSAVTDAQQAPIPGIIEDELLLRGLATERHGFHGVHRRAEDYRERLGRKVPECVAAAVVDIYNSQTGKKGALVKWWKAHNGGRLRRARGVPFDG